MLVMPLCMKGQDAFMQQFINDVVKEVVRKDFTHFYYIDSSFTFYGSDRLNLDDIAKEHPDFPKALITSVDSAHVHWCIYRLANGICVTFRDRPKYPGSTIISMIIPYDTPDKVVDSLNSLSSNQVFVPVKEHWGENKIKKETNKAWERKLENFEPEESTFYRFSTPVFSDDKKYALIAVDQRGQGSLYIFKFTGKFWVKIAAFPRWVS